jgi:AraC-like DNA-binding protein
MRRAAKALRDPTVLVKQAAAASGYADLVCFCHYFKRYFGVTPRQFRLQTAPWQLSRQTQFEQPMADFNN